VLAIVGAAAAVLLVVVVAMAVLRDGDDTAGRDDPSSGEDGSEESTVPETADPESTDPETTGSETTGSETTASTSVPTTAGPGALPEGWSPYIDPGGTYTIGLPPGWQVRRPDDSNRVDLVDPASGAFLRIDWVSPPAGDPVADWERQAADFAGRTPSYQEVGIQRVTYRNYDAALWEFRHEGLHTGNLAFVTNGRGYALMLRTPESQWAASQPLFEQFKQAFQPT
jgi:hypothetical protein